MSADRKDLTVLLSSATLVVFGQVLYSIANILERVIIARFLTPDAYGEVNISLAIMSVAVMIGLLGLRQGVPRFISRYDDPREQRGTWLTGLVVSMVLGFVLAAIIVFEVDVVLDLLFSENASEELVVLFALAIPFAIGIQVGVSAIRGLENTLYRTLSQDILYPGLRLVLVFALLWYGLDIVAAGYAYLIAAAVTFLVTHLLLHRLLPLVGGIRTHSRELMLFSLPLVLSTLLSRLLTWTDTFMLGFFRTSFEVGLYNAAYPLAGALSLILSSFGFIYFPMASRLDADNKRDQLNEIYRLTTKWIYLLTFPLFLLLAVFPEDVLRILFGQAYAPAGLALSILAIGFFTRASFGRNSETLSALGFTTYHLAVTTSAFTLNVILNLVLIPEFGYEGAAIASAASFIGMNLLTYAILKVKSDITPFSQWTTRTFVVLPVVFIPLAYALSTVVSLTVVTLLLFLALTGAGVVAVAALAGCLQSEDEIAVEFIEDRLGVSVPYIRRFIPDEE